jgi:hypothetical protein
MSPVPGHYVLSERQTNLCEYGGAFGVMLSLTCLIQHLVVTINNWITQLMIPGYIFAIIAFLFLGLKKSISTILLGISLVISLVMVAVWMKHQSSSVVVTSLFIYHVIMIVCMSAEDIPAKLKQKQRAEQEERDNWAGMI